MMNPETFADFLRDGFLIPEAWMARLFFYCGLSYISVMVFGIAEKRNFDRHVFVITFCVTMWLLYSFIELVGRQGFAYLLRINLFVHMGLIAWVNTRVVWEERAWVKAKVYGFIYG